MKIPYKSHFLNTAFFFKCYIEHKTISIKNDKNETKNEK